MPLAILPKSLANFWKMVQKFVYQKRLDTLYQSPILPNLNPQFHLVRHFSIYCILFALTYDINILFSYWTKRYHRGRCFRSDFQKIWWIPSKDLSAMERWVGEEGGGERLKEGVGVGQVIIIVYVVTEGVFSQEYLIIALAKFIAIWDLNASCVTHFEVGRSEKYYMAERAPSKKWKSSDFISLVLCAR